MTISSPVGTVGTYTFTSGNGRHGSYVTGYTLAQAGPGAVATAMALAGEAVHQDTPATELGHSSFKGYVRPTWTAASDDRVAGRRRHHLHVHPGRHIVTTTTWTFDYTGSLDTFVVPFHTPGTLTIAVYRSSRDLPAPEP